MGTSPAHILGDVMGEHRDTDGVLFFMIRVMTSQGAMYLDVPSQYVVVGDELDDLYPDLEETEA